MTRQAEGYALWYGKVFFNSYCNVRFFIFYGHGLNAEIILWFGKVRPPDISVVTVYFLRENIQKIDYLIYVFCFKNTLCLWYTILVG